MPSLTWHPVEKMSSFGVIISLDTGIRQYDESILPC